MGRRGRFRCGRPGPITVDVMATRFSMWTNLKWFKLRMKWNALQLHTLCAETELFFIQQAELIEKMWKRQNRKPFTLVISNCSWRVIEMLSLWWLRVSQQELPILVIWNSYQDIIKIISLWSLDMQERWYYSDDYKSITTRWYHTGNLKSILRYY